MGIEPTLSCESVGSIPTQVLRFFFKKKISGLVYKCYSKSAPVSDGVIGASNDTDDTQEEPGSVPNGKTVKL